MRNHVLYFSLLLVVIVRLILAATTPVFDTSEARYAAISANMARSNDFLVPRFTHRGVYQSFDGKPPLLFQAGGLSCTAFGVNEFAVRFPVLVATGLLLFLLYRVMLVLSNGEKSAALLAVALALTSTAYLALVGFCMTDGILVACVSGALLAHAALLKSQNRNWSLLVFALLGLGMLVKGPVAIVEFGLGVFLDCLVNRRWTILKSYRWFSGAALFLAIAAPWFVLMARANTNFLYYFFVNENLLRFLVHDYGDKYGAGRETFRGMAIVLLFVVTLPWALVPIAKGVLKRRALAPKAFRIRSAEPAAVLGWGVVGMTAFWSLTSRVPLAYLMPTVPLAAAWYVLTSSREERATLVKLVPVASVLSTVILAASLLVGMFATDKMQGAKAPYKPKRYSYEFYHGVHGAPPAEEVK